jgi:primosomal replication protein N''
VIETELSNVAANTEIVDASPTLAAYQEFRIRASRLGDRSLAIFRAFRAKEDEIVQLDLNDPDLCMRRTIGREARLSWKLRIEAAAPEVLLDTGELSRKIKALAEADAEIRVCNRDLLTDRIDVARVGSPTEWDGINRLRGPRALRLREFIDRAVDLGLMSLRPIWLMTPDVATADARRNSGPAEVDPKWPGIEPTIKTQRHVLDPSGDARGARLHKSNT